MMTQRERPWLEVRRERLLRTFPDLMRGTIIERTRYVRQRARGRNEAEMIEALVLLLASGGKCIDDINALRADRRMCRRLDHELPSADTLRRCLYAFHDDGMNAQAQAERLPGTVAPRTRSDRTRSSPRRVAASIRAQRIVHFGRTLPWNSSTA